ncbi:MAG TPA: hypothetical protein VIM11_18680 [Tepidisphaeraceae bacterium]|jgi:hypothetical protein
MPKRIRSDEQLRRLSYSDVTAAFRKAIKEWARTSDQAMGLEALSPAKRREIHDEIKWACRWFRDMDRAVELNHSGGAVYCAVKLCDLFAGLNRNIDVLPERNRMVPLAQRGEKDKREKTAGSAKTNAKLRKKFAAINKLKIKEDCRKLQSADEQKKFIYNKVAGDHHVSKRYVQKVVLSSLRKKVKKSGAPR